MSRFRFSNSGLVTEITRFRDACVKGPQPEKSSHIVGLGVFWGYCRTAQLTHDTPNRLQPICRGHDSLIFRTGRAFTSRP